MTPTSTIPNHTNGDIQVFHGVSIQIECQNDPPSIRGDMQVFHGVSIQIECENDPPSIRGDIIQVFHGVSPFPMLSLRVKFISGP
jgi:hypothetical protein